MRNFERICTPALLSLLLLSPSSAVVAKNATTEFSFSETKEVSTIKNSKSVIKTRNIDQKQAKLEIKNENSVINFNFDSVNEITDDTVKVEEVEEVQEESETIQVASVVEEATVSNDTVLQEETVEIETTESNSNDYSYNYDSGGHLTAYSGVYWGPSGKETYYNLDMSGVVAMAHNAGIVGDYWVRDDGVKMLGDYIMIAADVSGAVHNRYDIVETSLGTAMVVDTGTFAYSNPTQIDIATNW